LNQNYKEKVIVDLGTIPRCALPVLALWLCRALLIPLYFHINSLHLNRYWYERFNDSKSINWNRWISAISLL